MIDKNYNEWVDHEKQLVDEFVSKGRSFSEIENYPIVILPYNEERMRFKVRTRIDYFVTDAGMTLAELENTIVNDIPYIKSVCFISYFGSPIII
jgi:hypothetical protein